MSAGAALFGAGLHVTVADAGRAAPAIAALLGLDREADFAEAEGETPELLLAIGPAPRDCELGELLAAAGSGHWQGRANRLSGEHRDWPQIPAVEAACRKPSCVYPGICQNLNTDHSALTRLYREARRLPGVKKVLIAYSGSMESAKAMRHYIHLNPWPEVSLHIVHFKEGSEREPFLLKDAADFCQAHGFEVQTDLVDGTARQGLLEFALENDADLIVMGNSRRTFLLRRLFSETVLQAMQNADLPLFLSE